jgi:nucleosome assembly protein 1-like 1
MSDTKKEEPTNPQPEENVNPEQEKKEEEKIPEPEKPKEENKEEPKEEKEEKEAKEEEKVEPKEEKVEPKEEKVEKEEEKVEPKEENKEEEKPKEEKELNDEEEDRKELYDAIRDLKSDEVSDNVKSKLILLSDLHMEYKKFENDNYGKEYDELQDKYDKQYDEIYSKIDDIVNTTDKIELTAEEMEKYGITDDGETKRIDDYWEKVIINSRYFTITDKDKVILKYLTKVKMVKLPESVMDFKVDFYFKENEFFSNEILTKKYIYGKDALLKKAEGTTINWSSPDKNTTIEKVKKRIKKGKKYFTEYKDTKVDSFFSFFSQVEDMSFITDEVTFFKEDLFGNQLEYYMDIVSKTKNGGEDDDYDDDEEGEGKGGHDKGAKGEGNDGKKEECKNQ